MQLRFWQPRPTCMRLASVNGPVALIAVLTGCQFEPDIEPLVIPTVPPQPFSQFESSTASVPALADP